MRLQRRHRWPGHGTGAAPTAFAPGTEYLDNLEGNPILTGRTARAQAVIHMMQKRAESWLIDAIGIDLHHATPGLGPVLRAYKRPEWEGWTEWGQMHRKQAEAGRHRRDQPGGSTHR